MGEIKDSHLSISLSASVPLWIESYKGKSWTEIQITIKECEQVLYEQSENIIHRSEKKGGSDAGFNALAKSIACLSFVPGGVTCFGSHWESKLNESKKGIKS